MANVAFNESERRELDYANKMFKRACHLEKAICVVSADRV